MSPPVRIISHLAALGIGVAIAAGFSQQKSAMDSPGKKSPRETSSTVSSGRRDTKLSLSSSDFQTAWKAVATRKLNWRDRTTLQKQILTKWAAVDLEGALNAALKEEWDSGGVSIAGTYYFGNPLLEAFSQTFSDRPLDSWELIQSGKFGVATQLLRNQWLASVSKTDGLLVASMLGGLPASLQTRAIAAVMEGAKAGPEREAILAKIIDQAGDSHDDWIQEAFKKLPGGGDPGELRNRWSSLPEGNARKVTMMEWGASLRKMDAGKLSVELEALPMDARAEATRVMLSQITSTSPGLIAALDHAISAGQLEAVAKTSPSLIAGFAEQDLMSPAELAEWGANLPEGPETVEMFYKAVGRYIRDDLPRARGWLEAMPEGSWQREHGLAEFSQQSLWRKNDSTSSRWALDAISDPAIKAAALKWRLDWERQTGY